MDNDIEDNQCPFVIHFGSNYVCCLKNKHSRNVPHKFDHYQMQLASKWYAELAKRIKD